VAVSLELALHVTGDGETETALREHCAWLEHQGRHTPEYHECVAFMAMMLARHHWADADRYREAARRAEARKAARAARGKP
jgi:hypothetical protein